MVGAFLVLWCAAMIGGGTTLRAQEVEWRSFDSLSPADSIRNPDAVVARVGPLTITAREFFFNYLFGPSFAKRRADSRRRYLDFMVNEKLLALGAIKRGLEQDPRVIGSLAALEEDFATEELYRDDVLSRVSVSEADIERAVVLQQETVALRWLYFSAGDQASRADTVLRNGASFDSLFSEQFSGQKVAQDDRSTTTTRFDLERRNAVLASVVLTLQPGMPSPPVTAPDGWYILLVDSVNKHVVVTESALAELRASAKRAVVQMKADSLSSLYVRAMMLDAQPVIQRRAFDIVRAWIGARRLSPETFEAYGLANPFRTEGDSVNYNAPHLYGTLPLVTTGRGDISLADFLSWYTLRESNLTLRWTSPQTLFLSLEDLVWRMVRDRLLAETARSRGLETRSSVTRQLAWWKAKFLYQAEKDALVKNITWSDSTLKAHYAAHPNRFHAPGGKARSFEEARDDVLRDWHSDAVTERMLRDLTALRRSTSVTVDDEALAAIPVDASNDPRAIDVYAVKKGGTFPHPVFPSIDMAWQTWE